MRRRSFLTYSAASLPLLFNRLPSNLASSQMFNALASNTEDRVLVLIQLIGGNDGLNTLIPLDQYDNLANLRPNILLPQNQLTEIDDLHAFHPSFAAMRQVWDDGKLGIVQDVAYPSQNRSHFRSTDIWNTAPVGIEERPTGWLGRTLTIDHPQFPEGYPSTSNPDPLAISVGNAVSETCQGQATNFSLTVADPFSSTSILEGLGGTLPNTPRGRELQYLRTSVAQTNQYSAVVKDRAEAGNTIATYPEDNKLATHLQYIAQMISGGLSTKIYTVSVGGFDTHGDQVMEDNASLGNHPALLKQVADAIAAFQADLNALGLNERVIGMTYSEFGRRIIENGGLGTDHGTAAPMFLFGDCINAGILGDNPTIDPNVDEQEGVAMQYDFRDVYGSVLEDWMGVNEADVRNVLSSNYTKLPIIRDCNEVVNSVDESAFAKTKLTLSPSPFQDNAQINFALQRKGRVRLSVYDVKGSLIETLFERRLPAGDQTVSVNTRAYPPGVVVFHLQQGAEVKVVRGLKK